MGMYAITVDAKANSIAAQSQGGTVYGGQPAKVTFNRPLTSGDVLSIQTQPFVTWNSGGGPGATNADGVPVNPPQVLWEDLNPGTPEPALVQNYPAAAKYSFAIGSLVGSLDGGLSFFAIGTSFTTTILGNGLLPSANPPSIPTLLLFYWDVNCLDNTGAIQFAVQVTRPSAD